MNRQNFDKNSQKAYPLTIDRMAEAQEDWQAPMRVLAGMLPFGGEQESCILSGCEKQGNPGYALLKLSDGGSGYVYEVFEVKSGNQLYSYLHIVENPVPGQTTGGESVTVRVERYLEWTDEAAGNVDYAGLKRVWMKLAKKDDAFATNCAGGLWWHTPTNGTSLRVQRTGGRVRLWGSVKYGLQIAGVPNIIYTGNTSEIITERGATRTTSSTVPVLPEGYRPMGQLLIPMLYNGVASFAVIDSEGQLLISQEPELGDTMEIDTWIDV